ncbi:nucleoside phosphorylase domain-containing protein [Aspergillus multicolor]|uniref:nucleoside phosphorylase domain-containing protein n=1 Tax=Aspergillus multicolor TaxID=41759 RepID=UPI003CCD0D0B
MQPQPDPHEFEFAIICALSREFNAVEALLDGQYSDINTKRQYGDANFYQTARMGASNVVLVCLPEMGKASAASAAASLRSSFPNISLTLIVGIVLGDVIMSRQIVKFDFGRQYPGGFERKGVIKDTLDRSNTDVRSLLSALQTRNMRDRFQEAHCRHLQHLRDIDHLWAYPGLDKDRLVPSSCEPVTSIGPTPGSDPSGAPFDGNPIICKRLNTKLAPQPCLHFGPIGSGDTVMKSAKHRDELAHSDNIVGFEMEGVCDYADSHKNKDWQDYAAASAACCAKAFFEFLTEI